MQKSLKTILGTISLLFAVVIFLIILGNPIPETVMGVLLPLWAAHFILFTLFVACVFLFVISFSRKEIVFEEMSTLALFCTCLFGMGAILHIFGIKDEVIWRLFFLLLGAAVITVDSYYARVKRATENEDERKVFIFEN